MSKKHFNSALVLFCMLAVQGFTDNPVAPDNNSRSSQNASPIGSSEKQTATPNSTATPQKAPVAADKQTAAPNSTSTPQKAPVAADKQTAAPNSTATPQKAPVAADKQTAAPNSTAIPQKAPVAADKQTASPNSTATPQKAPVAADKQTASPNSTATPQKAPVAADKQTAAPNSTATPQKAPVAADKQTAAPSNEVFLSDTAGSQEPQSDKYSNNQPPTTSSSTRSSKRNDYRSLLEFKAGYFFFGDSKMREIYDQGGLDLQLCASVPVWRWLQVYASVEYLEKHGRSLKGHEKTRIWEIPLSLGLEAVARFCNSFQYYFTIGPRYFFVHQHTRSHFVDKSLSQNGLGGFVNTGFRYFPNKHFFVDVFGEYSYCRLHFHPHKEHVYGESAQVGGFTFGGGIGYAF
jgi:hypothetical protein